MITGPRGLAIIKRFEGRDESIMTRVTRVSRRLAQPARRISAEDSMMRKKG